MKDDKPWPWWIVIPAFIALVATVWGTLVLPLVWAPFAVATFALWGFALWGSFKGNFRRRK